jgi:hypothetical protein
MNVYLDLGDPGGSGFWNEGYMGKGREMGRSVYEQPGNEVDRILSQQGGFQVSKGKQKGSKREWKKGPKIFLFEVFHRLSQYKLEFKNEGYMMLFLIIRYV